MLILFIRTIFLYLLVFAAIRLTGKRQLSDLQPFDLVITLLLADLASVPASDTSIPLMYGVVPILGLLLLQQGLSLLSLKFEGIRLAICGKPLLMIVRGVVQEDAMRDARYTLNDMMEQLRGKDIFNISDVEYAILETNGQLSILLKSGLSPATCQDLSIAKPRPSPPFLLVQDGKIHFDALNQAGFDEKWLRDKVKRGDLGEPKDLLFAFYGNGQLHMQGKRKSGAKVSYVSVVNGR